MLNKSLTSKEPKLSKKTLKFMNLFDEFEFIKGLEYFVFVKGKFFIRERGRETDYGKSK